MKLAPTVAVGVGTFAITSVAALVVMWGWFLLLLILSSHISESPVPMVIRSASFVVFNVALGVLVVALPIWLASRGARHLGVSSIGALLTTAMLMGLAAVWFLQQLTLVNGCVSGVGFPLGGDGYGYCGDSRSTNQRAPP